MLTDTLELIERIYKYSRAYHNSGIKPPLFRLTPYEHTLFKEHLLMSSMFMPEYYGHLPTYMGVDFELVGKPILFDGKHIRSDSGIQFTKD